MPQRPSPWRVNDTVLYDALRDEARVALAGLLASSGARDASVADRITQARSELHDVNGFDRHALIARLDKILNAGLAGG